MRSSQHHVQHTHQARQHRSSVPRRQYRACVTRRRPCTRARAINISPAGRQRMQTAFSTGHNGEAFFSSETLSFGTDNCVCACNTHCQGPANSLPAARGLTDDKFEHSVSPGPYQTKTGVRLPDKTPPLSHRKKTLYPVASFALRFLLFLPPCFSDSSVRAAAADATLNPPAPAPL